MKAEDIATDFIANFKQNFMPAAEFKDATHRFTTSDLLHYGVSFDSTEDHSLDASFFVEQFKISGFRYIMIPGTIDLEWIFVEKVMSF
jgi:hypothetical protein